MGLVIKKDKLIFIFLPLITRVLMDFILIYYISVKWEYNGFILDLNFYKILYSYIALLIMLFLIMHYNKQKFSHFLTILFFFTIYLPMGSVYALMDKSNIFFIMVSLSFVVLVFFVILISKNNIKNTYSNNSNNNNKIFARLHSNIVLLVGINLVSIFTFIAMTVQNIDVIDFRILLNLVGVYDIRDSVTYYWGMNYFFSWQTKVINPFMIAICYINNRKVIMWIYIFFQLWLFVLTGHKMVLFTLLLILIIFKYLTKLNNLHLFFAQGFASLFTIASIEVILLRDSYIVDFFLRRVLYIPALLSNYYYDFFSDYGFLFWDYTLFGKLLGIEPEFKVVPSYIIGENYFNNVNTNAVTGFLGSEYMNGGFFGIIIATIIIIILFKTVDKLAEKSGNEVVLITLLTPIYTLWNTGLLTALLTGGIILSILLLYFTKREVQITLNK